MKDILIEIKNTLQGNNSKMDEAENQINDLENKEAKTNNIKQQEEKGIQNSEDSINSLCDNFKRSNICLMGCQKEKRKSKKLEIYLKK